MVLFTLVKYVLAFFFGYLVFTVVAPVVFETRNPETNQQWQGLPVSMLAFGDQSYGIWILFAVVIAVVIIIAGIAEANRNRNLEA
jgi:type II secretory pathway component PulF